MNEHDALITDVEDIIETQIRPLLKIHGGGITLNRVSEKGEVSLRFEGACRGCMLKSVTYALGVRQKAHAAPGSNGRFRRGGSHLGSRHQAGGEILLRLFVLGGRSAQKPSIVLIASRHQMRKDLRLWYGWVILFTVFAISDDDHRHQKLHRRLLQGSLRRVRLEPRADGRRFHHGHARPGGGGPPRGLGARALQHALGDRGGSFS